MLEWGLALVSCLLIGVSTLIAVPVVVLLVEIVAATVLSRNKCLSVPGTQRPSPIAVLVPAHNEGLKLLRTIADINAQMSSGDRLLIVAADSSDSTVRIEQ